MQNDYIACAIPYTLWFIEHQVVLHYVKDRAYLPILKPHSSSSGETSKDNERSNKDKQCKTMKYNTMKEATRTKNAKQSNTKTAFIIMIKRPTKVNTSKKKSLIRIILIMVSRVLVAGTPTRTYDLYEPIITLVS